jgi:hypothetical protein
MAADTRLKNLRGPGRRQFVQWATVVGATLGLDRSRLLNVINDRAGSALADSASGSSTMKSVHLSGDNGGLSWFTQLFPYPTIAMSGQSGVAYYSTPTATKPGNTTNPSVYAPDSPFQTLPAAKQMTTFTVGTNETHTKTPTSALALGNNNILAVASAIQSASPALLPVMAINPFSFGVAPGAAAPATVANSAGLVGLFNSVASQTLLKVPQNATLGQAYYNALLSLNAAAPRSAVQKTYATGRVANNLLAKNLASQLTPSAADIARYGMSASTPTTVSEIGNAMIIAAKAFALGLTNCMIIPAMQDDPHGAFADVPTLNSNVATFGKIFNAFMADCMAAPDPAGGSDTLGDNVVITIHGDTPKDALTASGWPDNTASNHNLLYVMGNGYLKSGWFGDLDTNGNLTTWDPNTGGVGTQTSAQLTSSATAAVAFAISKGDSRVVENFGGTPPPGIILTPNT